MDGPPQGARHRVLHLEGHLSGGVGGDVQPQIRGEDVVDAQLLTGVELRCALFPLQRLALALELQQLRVGVPQPLQQGVQVLGPARLEQLRERHHAVDVVHVQLDGALDHLPLVATALQVQVLIVEGAGQPAQLTLQLGRLGRPLLGPHAPLAVDPRLVEPAAAGEAGGDAAIDQQRRDRLDGQGVLAGVEGHGGRAGDLGPVLQQDHGADRSFEGSSSTHD